MVYYHCSEIIFQKINYAFYGVFWLVKKLYVKIEFSTTPFLHTQIRFLHTVLHILNKPIGITYIIT